MRSNEAPAPSPERKQRDALTARVLRALGGRAMADQRPACGHELDIPPPDAEVNEMAIATSVGSGRSASELPLGIVYKGRVGTVLADQLKEKRPTSGVVYVVEMKDDGVFRFVEKDDLNLRKRRRPHPGRIVGQVVFKALGRQKAGKGLGSLVRNK